MTLRNPFIRRIARHLNVSTLFRRPDTAADAPVRPAPRIRPAPLNEPNLPVAVLLPEARLQALPVGFAQHEAAKQPYDPPLSFLDENAAVDERVRQAERFTPAVSTGRAAAVMRSAAQPVTAEATPAPALQTLPGPPAAENLTADGLTREWPRLQAILRGHEITQTSPAEDVSVSTPVEAAAPSQTRPAGTPAKPVITEMDAIPPARIPAGVMPRETAEVPTAPGFQTPAQAPADTANAPADVSTGPAGGLSAQTNPAIEQPPKTLQTKPQRYIGDTAPVQTTRFEEEDTLVPAPFARAQPAALEKPGAEAAGGEPPVAPLSDQTGLADAVLPPKPAAGATEGAGGAGASASEAGRKPLEEVWPVQRQTDGPHPAQPGRQPADTPRFSQPEPLRPLEKAQTHQQIQAALQNVAVSQPTDSLVELITPRRPRPGKAPHLHAATPAQETAAPAAEETPAQPPQPSAADTLPATPRSSVQKADPPAAAEQTPRPALVETEIGLLPADLWHLMGEQPPPDRLYPAGQTSIFDGSADQPQNPSAGFSATAQQAQPLPANPDGLENGQTAAANPLIQRAVNITEVAGEVSPEPAGGSSTQTGQGHGGQLSPAAIDRLVKEVYAQIKRRFSIERERLHRD